MSEGFDNYVSRLRSTASSARPTTLHPTPPKTANQSTNGERLTAFSALLQQRLLTDAAPPQG